jgi:hypothetical protein
MFSGILRGSCFPINGELLMNGEDPIWRRPRSLLYRLELCMTRRDPRIEISFLFERGLVLDGIEQRP